MKILLIQPPIRDFYQTSIRRQPIGLAYLAAALRAQSHSVEILDCQTHRKRSIPLPSALSYLQEYYPFDDRSPFKLYSGYYHFGMGWEEINARVEDAQADVFGISSAFTPYHGEALEVARIIKQGDRGRIVVMGGAHVSCDPHGVLENPLVDYVVLGEGELRFPILLEQLESGYREGIEKIDGIGYRVDGRVRINPLKTFVQDLDGLPHPARGLLDPDRYRIKKKRATMIITSRGCPHGCAYCSTRFVMGASFRERSPEGILQEMAECHHHYGIRVFDIEDDNFTFNKERAKKLLNLMLDRFGEGNLHLSAMNGISFASLDRELLGLMKRAGFQMINLSFVSADPSIKEQMHRPHGIVGFDEIVAEAARIGLHVIAYAIIGMPGQTVADMVETLIYLMERMVLIGPSVYYPAPGTALFELCKREGILPTSLSQWRSSALPIETKDFDRLDIATLLRLTRVINFIKGRMEQDELPEGITWAELRQVLSEQVAAQIETTSTRSYGTERDYTWRDLVLLLMDKRAFFSLREDHAKRPSIVQMKSSRMVLDYFFAQAWERPILKS
jgi:anaerobic magnesium-protoporphyrin IX monomethyl ester cyclase